MPDVLWQLGTCREKRKLQKHSLISASESHKVEKCVKFALTNGLSKNYQRKYWMTDRSSNRIRSFSEVQHFWTPICTSNSHCRELREETAKVHWVEVGTIPRAPGRSGRSRYAPRLDVYHLTGPGLQPRAGAVLCEDLDQRAVQVPLSA